MNKYYLSVLASAMLGLAACGGDDGDNGMNGDAGMDGEPGENGENGDPGKDGEPGENGDPGEDGETGAAALVKQTMLEVGSEGCANGGLQFDSGSDDNGNGELDDGEISETSYVCVPARSQLSGTELRSNLGNTWYGDSAYAVERATSNTRAQVRASGQAKNVILFVGDGMGISTVTAARILDGQKKGMMGEENVLSFGHFPYAGLAKTYNVDAQTPDSAGTMTAMMTGVKTDVGVIGVDEDIVRGDCSTVAGNELVTALELAEIAGKSTGVISTARITHATPAATYSKSADRNWEDVSDMPQAAVDGGCEDIASQLVNFEANLEARMQAAGVTVDVDGIDVVMGGGRRHFLPNDPGANSPDAVSATEGDRTDGRNLVTEWTAQYPAGVYVYDQAGFDAVDPAATSQVFGLFNESHMQYEADRGNDIAGEPSIEEMTVKAIDVLDNNDEGFFLMVESGRIDHAHHAGNAAGALSDTIAFAEAIQAAVDNTDPRETLIIVTADHGHVFTIAGYPKRGNPILGKVVGVGSDTPTNAVLTAFEFLGQTLQPIAAFATLALDLHARQHRIRDELRLEAPVTLATAFVDLGRLVVHRARVDFMPERKLMVHYELERGAQKMTWDLREVVGPAVAKAAVEQRLAYPDTDYADIGDNESDPSFRRMINLGFIEHGASGVYDEHGHELASQHGHAH